MFALLDADGCGLGADQGVRRVKLRDVEDFGCLLERLFDGQPLGLVFGHQAAQLHAGLFQDAPTAKANNARLSGVPAQLFGNPVVAHAAEVGALTVWVKTLGALENDLPSTGLQVFQVGDAAAPPTRFQCEPNDHVKHGAFKLRPGAVVAIFDAHGQRVLFLCGVLLAHQAPPS